MMGDLVFLDTETTGIKADEGHRIVDVAAVRVSGRTIDTEHFQAYINPERKMDAEAERIHGLSDRFLRDKPIFSGVADGLVAFIEGSRLHMHNAKFDQGFLDMEFARIGKPQLKEVVEEIVDTLTMARRQFPTGANSLNRLCERFGIDISDREIHGALKDARLLAQVYLAMTCGQMEMTLTADATAASSASVSQTGPVRGAAKREVKVIEAGPGDVQLHEAWMAELQESGASASGAA